MAARRARGEEYARNRSGAINYHRDHLLWPQNVGQKDRALGGLYDASCTQVGHHDRASPIPSPSAEFWGENHHQCHLHSEAEHRHIRSERASMNQGFITR